MQHSQLDVNADSQTQISFLGFPCLKCWEVFDIQPENPANNLCASIHATEHTLV